MKVAIYARVSTDEQELAHQIDACQRFCDYRKFEVAVTYSEKVSGYKGKRPEYLKLVSELRNMNYDGVVVFRLDRLGRNSRELALLVDELENKGIKVFSVNENFDTSTAMGRAMRELIYIFAELERSQIAEATTQRLKVIKESGQRLGQVPTSDFQVAKVKELSASGLSPRKIAAQMNISHVTVWKIVNQKGYYSPKMESDKKQGC